jgi:hypothetical protein
MPEIQKRIFIQYHPLYDQRRHLVDDPRRQAIRDYPRLIGDGDRKA